MRYTVKQASSLTGIAPDRLRAWERRYGIVTPDRTESRYRLYDDSDLARLRLMVRLVDSGMPASLAAEEVRTAYTDRPVTAPHPSSSPAPLTAAALPLDALVRTAQSLDHAEMEQLLDRAFASDAFEAVVEHWLLPALAAVGDGWRDGRVDVAGEHFVSAAVRRRLGRFFDAAASAEIGPAVLVGLPPGSMHELGSLTFATCLRRLRVDVRWLGSDLPVESWAHAVRQVEPVAVVLSVPRDEDAPAASEVVRRLQGSAVRVVFLGGRGATQVGAAHETDTPVSLLPFSVVEAAQTAAAKIRGIA